MPIPVNPDYYLLMNVMRPDGLPESNTFVNTLFFRNDESPDSSEAMADNLKEVMDAFWTEVNAPGAVTLESQLSSVIDPTLTQYRIYDLGVAAPRPPIIRDSAMANTGGSVMPNECAAVLSYFSGQNSPRKRGRIYIGPLAEVTRRAHVAGEQDARLSSAFMAALRGGALDILNTTQPVTWVQYSRVANAFSLVTQGWVDDRYDTQRRRGAPETLRETWGP